MGFLAERVDTGRINPAVVEVEERADRNGVVDGGVRPAGLVQRGDIRRSDVNRIAIDFIDETQECLLGFGERRRRDILDDSRDQGFVPEQFRRNCGVRFQSKRAIVACRSVSGNEFAEAGAQRGGFAHDGLREALQVLGGMRLKREHVPDLWVLGAGFAGGLDEIPERALGFGGFHIAKKHGFHGVDLAIVPRRPVPPP
jgi:hypothetical protein